MQLEEWFRNDDQYQLRLGIHRQDQLVSVFKTSSVCMGTILFYRTNKRRNARTPNRKQTNKGKPNPTCTCLLQGIQVVIIPNIIRDLNDPPGRRNWPGLFNFGLLSRGTLTRVLIPSPPLGTPSHPGGDRLLGKTICPKV